MFRFGVFEVEVDSQQVRKSGLRVRLQAKPFEVLRILLERAGEVVTREELYRALWTGDTFGEFDHNLNNAINRLRRTLNDCAATPRYIETLPRVGYRFIAPVVRQTFPVEPASSAPSLRIGRGPIPPEAVRSATFVPPRRWIVLAASLFLGLLAVAGSIYHRARSDKQASSADSQKVRDARDLYAKGRYLWNKRNREQIGLAITYFDEAIDADPRSALAYSGLADSYSVLGMMVPNPREYYQKAEQAARMSVGLAENSGEAHASLALVHLCNFRFDEAAVEFHKGLALKPDYATAHQWYGLYLRDIGESAAGLRELEIAHQLDPASPQISFALANAYRKDGLYAEAEKHFQDIVSLDSSFLRVNAGLALLYASEHRLSKSLATSWTAEMQDDFPELSEYVAIGLYQTGKKEEAIQLMTRIARRVTTAENVCFPFLLAAMGETEQSIHCLEKGYGEQAGYIPGIKSDPILSKLHSDPRFQYLLARVGFPPNSSTSGR